MVHGRNGMLREPNELLNDATPLVMPWDGLALE